ncbi:hypothetical protein B0J13DRAFT_232821 [Dactylonectria estremocensis]|uniref:Anaphase-promoting complex subunit 11 n=1 Tax=Dactylonectria estremocensis TaxID=1079267 RepID=A0A9P9F945_9HYPO|nr:hypothetical protein B0J13DRAFT_232821 [Dactylonectria estremocensis]
MGSSDVPQVRNQNPIAPASEFRIPQRASMAAPRSRVGGTPQHPIDLTGDSTSTLSRKRKAGESSKSPIAPLKRTKAETAKLMPEKRLLRFRSIPPSKFHTVYARALSQRFFVLGRARRGSEDCPEEIVEMTGSTGNIYTVVIAQIPSCDCPHAKKGNQCKHLFYVLKQVLNAPYEMVYQAAFLSSELRDIFAAAPPISTSKQAETEKRKPIEGDCPICFSELEAKGSEIVVWCRAACGQNMHEECFNIWARTKQGDTTCPMCRSVWKDGEDSVKKVRREEGHSEEGYVNVGAQLGLRSLRDESSYHRSGWWGQDV